VRIRRGRGITAQPFPLYTKGMNREDALALIRMREATRTALNIALQ
jgi:hypothetical protein